MMHFSASEHFFLQPLVTRNSKPVLRRPRRLGNICLTFRYRSQSVTLRHSMLSAMAKVTERFFKLNLTASSLYS